MQFMHRFITIIVSIVCAIPGFAQIVTLSNDTINSDSIRREFDSGPYFGLYKDNYFIFGTSIGEKPTKQNTNVKFQISIAQKLTKSVLPWGTYLYLFYTQKVFWNVLEDSMPMTDLNFNPGIGLAKPLFWRNRYIGKVNLIVEHESNGKDGDASRSWNKVSFGGSILIDPKLMVHAKGWIPIIDGVNNRDILKYCGIYQLGMSYLSASKRFGASVILVKRKSWKFNYNTALELYYRFRDKDNQYIFAQYYNGYGEGLLDYKQFHSQLRIGIVIRPTFFSEY
ncbi:MAG: phospholipase A [Muribaculaceae bacterium]|nr:phospholipase A [Muribaculaceae bacterium]